MWKTNQVVMLPTNEKANVGNIVTRPSDNRMAIVNVLTKDDPQPCIHQHLYIISDEEIEEGDWFVDDDRMSKSENNGIPNWKVRQCTNIRNSWIFFDQEESQGCNPDWSKKIIACTDDSLRIGELKEGGRIEHLPQPSQSFVEFFVEQYNLGNIITDVMVEHEEICARCFSNDKNNCWSAKECSDGKYDKLKLKVNPDNTINIEPFISDFEVIGEKIVEYCKQYEGTDKYNDVLKAIEFGYQLSIDENL